MAIRWNAPLPCPALPHALPDALPLPCPLPIRRGDGKPFSVVGNNHHLVTSRGGLRRSPSPRLTVSDGEWPGVRTPRVEIAQTPHEPDRGNLVSLIAEEFADRRHEHAFNFGRDVRGPWFGLVAALLVSDRGADVPRCVIAVGGHGYEQVWPLRFGG